MPNFQTVEQMLDELDSLASSSSDEEDDDDDDDDDEDTTESSSSSTTTSSDCSLSTCTELNNNEPELPIYDDSHVVNDDTNVLPADDEEDDYCEARSRLSTLIRQYCCSCHLLRVMWRSVMYTQDESSQHEPLLLNHEDEDTKEQQENMTITDSSSSSSSNSTKPNAPKRSFSAEERVMALIHQKQSATAGQGPKPLDTLQELLLQRNRSITTCSSKDLPTDYWVPWNTDGYSLELTKAVRQGDLSFVQHYQGNLQCSSPYGESILHVAARRGDLVLLQYIHEERHVSLRVSCESARNILHDACWTSRPSFACITWLLEQVPELLLVQDARGRTPLEYAPADTWKEWNAYLVEHAEQIVSSAERLKEMRV